MVEAPCPATHAVDPQDTAARRDANDGSGVRIVDHDDRPVTVELRVRRIAHRDMDVEDDPAVRRETDNPRTADLRDQQAAVRQRGISIRLVECLWGVMDARTCPAPLAHDALARIDLEDPAVSDVGDHDVAVRERIGVIGRMQVTARSTRSVVDPVLPDDSSGPDVDPIDHLVRLVVRDDRSTVGRDEGVVGRERLAARQASVDRERPDRPPAIVDDEQPAVAPVCDQEATREPRRTDRWLNRGGRVGRPARACRRVGEGCVGGRRAVLSGHGHGRSSRGSRHIGRRIPAGSEVRGGDHPGTEDHDDDRAQETRTQTKPGRRGRWSMSVPAAPHQKPTRFRAGSMARRSRDGSRSVHDRRRPRSTCRSCASHSAVSSSA